MFVGLLLCYGLFDCAFLFSVSLGCLCGVVVLCWRVCAGGYFGY